jgi:hypothetical protein
MAVVHALLLPQATRHCAVHDSNDEPIVVPLHGVTFDRSIPSEVAPDR